MNSNQKAPLSPQQLFNRLFNADFRAAECQDQTAKLHHQRQILMQLIVEYEDEIKKAQLLAIQEQKLANLKQRLLVELEALKTERTTIDARLEEELNSMRVARVDSRDQQTWIAQVNEARSRNNKLKIRIRDLMGYIEKLELQNRRLQQERRVIQISQVQRRQLGDEWRNKIQFLKKEHLSYEGELRDKIRLKEEEALRNIKMQEMQIHERNQRRRMESLSGRINLYGGEGMTGRMHSMTSYTPAQKLTSRFVRQI